MENNLTSLLVPLEKALNGVLLPGRQLQIELVVAFFFFNFYLVAYLSSYHEKAINALYELA